jgi:hypothetical protein
MHALYLLAFTNYNEIKGGPIFSSLKIPIYALEIAGKVGGQFGSFSRVTVQPDDIAMPIAQYTVPRMHVF